LGYDTSSQRSLFNDRGWACSGSRCRDLYRRRRALRFSATKGGVGGEAARSTQKYTRACLCLPPNASVCLSLRGRRLGPDRPPTSEFALVRTWIGLFRPNGRPAWALASQRRSRRFRSDHLHHENRLLDASRRRFSQGRGRSTSFACGELTAVSPQHPGITRPASARRDLFRLRWPGARGPVVVEAVGVCGALAELRDVLPVALTEVEDDAHRARGLRGGSGDTVEEPGQPPFPVAVIADGRSSSAWLAIAHWYRAACPCSTGGRTKRALDGEDPPIQFWVRRNSPGVRSAAPPRAPLTCAHRVPRGRCGGSPRPAHPVGPARRPAAGTAGRDRARRARSASSPGR